MTTFLQKLSVDLLQRFGNDLSRVAVIFPNKRASLFLNRELARQTAILPGCDGVLWSPSYITISDLFRKHSDLEVADQILLVCRLYDVFIRCTGFEAETLDHFFNWGILLLSDFDDLDKNMADPKKVFSLVSELHEFDSNDYLTENQFKALKEFFNTFSDNHTSLLREKFLRLWNKLYDIYTIYKDELRADGIAYEGMLYRDVCENSDSEFTYDYYCFVGFNMLQRVEQTLFTRLKNEGKALFYWDYDSYYLKENHEAGHFISDYLLRFPQAAPIHSDCEGLFGNKSAKVDYISSPTENLQARYVHDWLLEKDRWKCGPRTAIVMSDERLLQTIIRSLPEEVKDVNITTGYPLSQTPVMSLLHHLIELQTEGRISGTENFRLKQVNNILQHPLSQYISPQSSILYKYLNTKQIYYPTLPLVQYDGDDEFVLEDEGFAMLFCNLDITYEHLPQGAARTGAWLMDIVHYIAHHFSNNSLYAEALFRAHQVLQRLHNLITDATLTIDQTTYRRLLTQIVQTTTIPYHGEPVAGIQIMGVLETRCLDFDHVLLLSCNEGNMPKGVNDSSFIPHSVRLAYGMTTVEHKVGIYSYYFHRLLQRAGDVTIAYNSSTEGLNTGEMSRFMLQLMVESGIKINQTNITTGQDVKTFVSQSVTKDDAVMRRLRRMFFPYMSEDKDGNPVRKQNAITPSSLGVYLRCQLRYYYQHVMGLKEEDAGIDEIDNRIFGNIFHTAAELLYNKMTEGNDWITADAFTLMLKNKRVIEEIVDKAFRKELFHIDDKNNSFRPNYSGLQIVNRKVIIQLLEDLLRYDSRHAPIKILGTELWVNKQLEIEGENENVIIGGIVDRLDKVQEAGSDTVRVVDYKTGFSVPSGMESVEEIFNPQNIKNHSDYYLQAFLYSCIIKHSAKHNNGNNSVKPALLYVQKVKNDSYVPWLTIGKETVEDISTHEDDFLKEIAGMIHDILDPSLKFSPTDNKDNCKYCPFANMCKM